MDIVGDGLQNGGALLVMKNGESMQHFVQSGPADRLSNTDIVQVVIVWDSVVEVTFTNRYACRIVF